MVLEVHDVDDGSGLNGFATCVPFTFSESAWLAIRTNNVSRRWTFPRLLLVVT